MWFRDLEKFSGNIDGQGVLEASFDLQRHQCNGFDTMV